MSTDSPSEPDTRPYSPPVDRLLSLGEAAARAATWPDYVGEYGFDMQHVPELIRLATDESFLDDPGDAFFGPLHAWRTLGQLEADEAVTPLIGLLISSGDNDWVQEELPEVLGMIGDSATPPLGSLLADPAEDVWARIAAARALEQIAAAHPDCQDEVVAALIRQLGEHPENDPTLNGFIISYLMDLDAVAAAPLMDEAFAADNVDVSVAGDWEDVQVGLGLLEKRITPRPHYHAEMGRQFEPLLHEPAHQPPPIGRPGNKQKSKNKRKMQKASRKRNRKR